MARPIITADQFDDIAANHCSRWASTSLAIARALIVDGAQLSDVARQHDCTTQYANVVRARFYTKAQKVRVSLFTKSISTSELEAYKGDLKALHADKTPLPLLVKFLAEQGVKTTPKKVAEFIEGNT